MTNSSSFVIVRDAFDDIILWNCRCMNRTDFERFVLSLSTRAEIIMIVFHSSEHEIINGRVVEKFTEFSYT